MPLFFDKSLFPNQLLCQNVQVEPLMIFYEIRPMPEEVIVQVKRLDN